MAAKSIMNCILEALDQDGRLPMGFRLPEEGTVAAEMQFLDGAEDGVRLYHMKAREVDLMPYTSVIYQIKSGENSKARRALRRAVRESKKLFVRMIDVVGPLQEWMAKHPNVMQDERFLQYALQELMTSDDRDAVKFALAIVSNYTLDEKGQIPKMIRVLALSDEFTFQCVTMMRDWKNGNDEIFEVAQRVRGWGKIHAVHYLEPETETIRRWMLAEGCKNDIRAGYSAREVAVKLPLIKMITEEKLSEEEFSGLCSLMDGLMDDAPIPGISALHDGDILMDVFLKAAEGRRLTREGVSAVSRIRAAKEAK